MLLLFLFGFILFLVMAVQHFMRSPVGLLYLSKGTFTHPLCTPLLCSLLLYTSLLCNPFSLPLDFLIVFLPNLQFLLPILVSGNNSLIVGFIATSILIIERSNNPLLGTTTFTTTVPTTLPYYFSYISALCCIWNLVLNATCWTFAVKFCHCICLATISYP